MSILLEKVADLENLRRGFRNLKASVTTTMNEDFYTRTRTFMEDRLLLLHKQLEKFIYDHEHGDEILADCDTKIADLNVRIKKMKSSKEIAALIKLRQQIQNIEDGLGPCLFEQKLTCPFSVTDSLDARCVNCEVRVTYLKGL